MELEELKEHVEYLCTEHLQAIASFHSWEELQLFRSVAVLDRSTAQEHVTAVKEYAGFLMAAEHALQTQTHISLAKLFIGNDQSLTIQKLLEHVRKNPPLHSSDAQDYTGFTEEDFIDIERDLTDVRPIVRHLGKLRNKVVAHIDLKERDVERLMRAEVVQLIELSDKLLNAFSVSYWGTGTYFGLAEDQAKMDTSGLLGLIVKERHKRLRRSK